MRGGKREGAGRKPVPLKEQRVSLTVRVLPRTKAVLDELKDSNGRSYGKLIDEIVGNR